MVLVGEGDGLSQLEDFEAGEGEIEIEFNSLLPPPRVFILFCFFISTNPLGEGQVIKDVEGGD